MHFLIIGAGAWGTAMALHLQRLNHTVSLAPRRFAQALELSSSRENTDYLPGFKLPHTLQVGWQIGPLLLEADAVILACPSHGLREACERIRDHREGALRLRAVINLAKGMDPETFATPGDILGEILPDLHVGSLSGPNYAAEVAAGKPAAMVLGMEGSEEDRAPWRKALSGSGVRVYTTSDRLGVELGGALKNVYAIAAGVADGLAVGDNGKAALLTRSLAEMVRLGTALGASAETFYGLSGFGDLVATCFGEWSRNRVFGEEIGRGRRVRDLLADRRTVVEGYRSTASLHALCQKKQWDAPILRETHAILYGDRDPSQALTSLFSRNLKEEATTEGN